MTIPEGLAEHPPGPRLGALLAGIDHTAVANNDLLPVLAAQYRQACHEAARLLGVIAEVGRANPTFDDDAVDRLAHPFVHAADEVRAALAWSRRAADSECGLAEQLVHELPIVYAAFLGGMIDRSKVRVFADHLAGLTAEQVHTVCTALVPIAGRLTPGQIAVRLRRLIAAIDPRHYERRYRKALRDRLVHAYLDDTGAVVLTVRGLTPTQAAAALERVDLLAHAARRAGHRSTLDQIRVDIVAGLLDGTLHHLNRDQIIAHLIAHRATNDDPPAAPDIPTATAPVAPPGTAAPGPTGAAAPAPTEATAPGSAGAAPVPAAAAVPGSTGAAARGNAEPTAGGNAKPAAPGNAEPTASGNAGPAVPEDQRTGVEIRVALSTLLGHDEHPGEIPGLGPVPATEARATVTHQRHAEWRYAITDARGQLIFDGRTRRRPLGLPTDGPPGGIVELHIPATLLAQLTDRSHHPPGQVPPGQVAPGPVAPVAWAVVLADIARQYAERHKRDLDARPHDRFPRAGLRRHTQIRDRSCVGPGCRQRPQRCDQDHTTEHQHGGQTVAGDLAPLCRHDHGLKSAPGWGLDQPEPGRFIWTSPLGGRYPVQPEPILPALPDPHPATDDPAHDRAAPTSPENLVLYRPDPPPAPDPPPPPPDPEDPPPF